MTAPAFWAGRTAVVTGGCGFIGSHLVESLLDHGAEVRVLDSYNSSGHWGWLEGTQHPSLEIRLGDVADPWFTGDVLAGADVVFHLAALIAVPHSYRAPAEYVRTNIGGTLAVLEAVRRHGIHRVVHTSTSEVYGSAQVIPMNEDHPLAAQSPYAASKIAADQLALSYWRSYDTPVVVVRPFNTYGPRQSLRALIPSCMAQALFESEICAGALAPVRDYSFVSDVVRAVIAAASVDNAEGEVFNVGSGSGITVAGLIDAVQAVAGTAKPVRFSPERTRPPGSEVDRLICDATKARARLGYAPTVDLGAGLTFLRDFYAKQPPPRPSEFRL